MSSPPLDFPSDDGTQNGTPRRSTRSASRPQQTPSRAPRQQLFSPGTPSAAGTPPGSQAQQTTARRGANPLFVEGTPSAAGTPAGSVVARRNLGLESRTPRRTPQAGTDLDSPQSKNILMTAQHDLRVQSTTLLRLKRLFGVPPRVEYRVLTSMGPVQTLAPSHWNSHRQY